MNIRATTIGMTVALVLCAAAMETRTAHADVELKIQEWGVIKDVNGNGVLDEQDKAEGELACITNMLQYLSAGTSYDYKQYLTPAGSGPNSDTSGFPNNSDGHFVNGGNTTWLEPQKDELQFWMAFSRQDHDPDEPDEQHYEGDFDLTPKGFNLNMIMNRPDRLIDANDAENPTFARNLDTWEIVDAGIDISATYGHVIYKPTEGVVKNTVGIDFAIVGSTLGERVILSDDVDLSSDPATPPDPGNPDRPTQATPVLPGQELKVAAQGDLAKQTGLDSYDSYFTGDWTYNEDTTDGGIFGDLLPGAEPGNMIIRVDLNDLGDQEDGIKKIVFYTFVHDDDADPGFENPYLMTWQKIELELAAGDTFFIWDKCCPEVSVPEPITLALMGLGGLGMGAVGVYRRRRRRTAAA